MTRTVLARAPGKLFVVGEYAVLDGCPAVVAAVDRFVSVQVRRGAIGTVTLIAPGFATPLTFRAAEPPRGDDRFGFVLAAYRSAVEQVPALRDDGVEIEVRSDLAASDGTKTGLGSSAAVAVATVAALFAAAGADPEDRHQVFATAWHAHRAEQGGLGSGADVAAAVFGGLVLFQGQAEALPVVAPLAVPPATALLAAWTGQAASTVDLVRAYANHGARGREVRQRFLARGRECVERFVAALRRGALDLDALNAYGDALDALGADLEQPLMTPALSRLVAAARACGAGAKLSGAGSGDCGIALTSDADVARRVREAWRAAGLRLLDVAICAGGVSYGRG